MVSVNSSRLRGGNAHRKEADAWKMVLTVHESNTIYDGEIAQLRCSPDAPIAVDVAIAMDSLELLVSEARKAHSAQSHLEGGRVWFHARNATLMTKISTQPL